MPVFYERWNWELSGSNNLMLGTIDPTLLLSYFIQLLTSKWMIALRTIVPIFLSPANSKKPTHRQSYKHFSWL